LKRLPEQTVKTDRSFSSGLPADKGDAAITDAVMAMARRLGLNVMAEGAEAHWRTKAQIL
jgi:diguanylate cyclase